MAGNFTIEVDGYARLNAALDRLFVGVEDFRKLPGGWKPFARIRYLAQELHLESEGASTGASFRKLTAGYAAEKRRAGFGMEPILQRTGAMFRSLVEQGAPHNVHIESPDEFISGSTDPIAYFHHIGAGSLPERIAMRVTERELAAHARQLVETGKAHGRLAGFEVTA